MHIEGMPLVMFEFVGGILDGQTICSDSEEHAEAQRAAQLYLWFRLGKGYMERSEQTDRTNVGLFRQPSPNVAEIANRENWSEAQRNAMMPYYNYRVTGWQELDDLLLVRLKFVDTDG